jgi:hypothetical protein
MPSIRITQLKRIADDCCSPNPDKKNCIKAQLEQAAFLLEAASLGKLHTTLS